MRTSGLIAQENMRDLNYAMNTVTKCNFVQTEYLNSVRNKQQTNSRIIYLCGLAIDGKDNCGYDIVKAMVASISTYVKQTTFFAARGAAMP